MRVDLNARWERLNARLAAEVQARGCLPAGELTEEEIAEIAIEMAR